MRYKHFQNTLETLVRILKFFSFLAVMVGLLLLVEMACMTELNIIGYDSWKNFQLGMN